MSWFAKVYNPLQAGSIDGTDTLPHDKAVARAMRAKYNPPGVTDGVTLNSFKTIFVGRLSHEVDEDILLNYFGQFGHIETVKVIRNIVTGEPKGYGFIEFSEETACISAYQRANRALLGSKTILVDYERSRCMKGWVPRRLGGGLSGRKESGQLRFGGRDKPFKRPLNLYKSNDRNIPDIEFDQKYDDNWRKATHANYAPSRSTQHLSSLERTSNKREQLGSPTNGPRKFSVRQDSHGRHTTGPVYYNRHHNSSRSSYQSSAGVTHRRSEVGAEEFRDRTTPSEQRRNSSSVDVRTRRRSPSPRRRFVDNDRRRKDDYGDGERQDSYDRTRREYRHSRNKR